MVKMFDDISVHFNNTMPIYDGPTDMLAMLLFCSVYQHCVQLSHLYNEKSSRVFLYHYLRY